MLYNCIEQKLRLRKKSSIKRLGELYEFRYD